MGKADRKEALQQETTRALMNIEDITDYSLITSNMMNWYFISSLQPIFLYYRRPVLVQGFMLL